MSFPKESLPVDPMPGGAEFARRDTDHLPLLSLVVPFYNEQDMLPHFFGGVIPELERIPNIRFEILCVNDGSRDRTLDGLVAYAHADARVRVVDLTRNFGKEAALTAAIFEARGDLIVPFDADLQDPPTSSANWSRNGAKAMTSCWPSASTAMPIRC